MRILFLGDCHGHLGLVSRACETAARRHGVEAAIQVGDFGFHPVVIDRYLRGEWPQFAVPLYVIDGNHEHHEWLMATMSSGECHRWERRNLFYRARGSTMSLGGLSIGFLGGALHVDRPQEWGLRPGSSEVESLSRRRSPHPDPLWSNWISDGDRRRAIDAFLTAQPDVLVTHTCPAGIGVGLSGSPLFRDDVARNITKAGFSAGPRGDCGDMALTEVWNSLRVKPKLWVFGHFHRLHFAPVCETHFLCVGSTDDSDSTHIIRAFILDTNDAQCRLRMLPGNLFEPCS